MDCTGTSGGLSLSFRDESMRMERLLGSICQPLQLQHTEHIQDTHASDINVGWNQKAHDEL